jgi:Flp pilus assembly protein TadG
MVIRRLQDGRRWGAVLVETSVIIGLVAMLVFGVFEYARLLMDWDLLNNAAREGCRYALVHNTDSTINTDVQTIVTNFMGGQTSSFTNFTVTVSGTYESGPQQGVSTQQVNTLAAGDLITVTVSGTYKFMNIIPLIKMPSSFPITTSVTMVCEGAM